MDKINEAKDGSCGYLAFSHNGKKAEVYANTMLEAKELAIKYFKTPKGKRHLTTVVLCEVNGKEIISNIS